MSRFAVTFKVLAFSLVLLGLMVLGAGLAQGQAISGNVVGTVVDSTGAAVANAEVSALNVGTGFVGSSKTNGTGEYRFENLSAGPYRITVRSTGFRTTTVSVDVRLNTTSTANVKLEPGASTETVEVSGEAPILDTTTAQIGNTYEERQLQGIPTSGLGVNGATGQNLGVLNLALLDSGVSSSGGLGAGTGPSVGGQRPRNNNFTVEGVDNNDKGVTGPLIYVPPDAVGNFTVLQNQFSPEFGHSTGGQFNQVVVGGTNTFHGRVYEYFQNKNLNAIDASVVRNTPAGETPKNPRYDSNRFGGQLGGPVFKNKLFFFVNYERNPLGQASALGQAILAPTEAGYATLLALPGVSANNVSTLKQYATAPSGSDFVDVGGVPIQIGTVPVIAPNFTNYNTLVTSMDYNISERDQVRGRYIYNKLTTIDTAAQLPIFYTPFEQPYHLVALSEYHTFSPYISNELRVGYNRTGNNFSVPDLTFPGLDAFPNVTIDELNNINIGPDGSAPQYAVQNLYQAADNLTWTKGNHTLKFGLEGRKSISPQKFIQRSRGDYEWATLDAYAHDLEPDFAERSFGDVGYSGDQYSVFWYVNDIWKVRPNFSLNLGLRYEYTSTPFGWTQQSLNSVADAPGLITFGSPQAPTTDFMPRVGFAWSPGGNTSIRGGVGMGYDVLYDNIGTLSRPPQIGFTVDCPGNSVCPTSDFLANGGIGPQPSSGITVYDQATARSLTSTFLPNDVKYPYSISWNFGVQHVFASNYTAEIRYVGTRGVNLNVQNRLNVQDVVTPGHSLPTYSQNPGQAALDSLPLTLDDLNAEFDADGFLVPQYLNAGFTTPIVAFMPFGASTYHGLQTQLNRRFNNGLQFQVAYTFSHNIDNSTADFFSTIITPRRPQDFRNLSAERSNSALDHRHRFTVQAMYELPFFKKDANWFKRNVLGGYQFVPIYTYETGEWGTVQSGIDSNLNGDNAGDRVILNAGGVAGTGSDVTALTNTGGAVVAYLADNPNAQYFVAGAGALANTGRNILRTPAINNWDLSMAKVVAINERARFEFSAGLLNAFNHPQFTPGSVNQVGSISRVDERNYLIAGASDFNQPRNVWPSNARQMFLGMKFIF